MSATICSPTPKSLTVFSAVILLAAGFGTPTVNGNDKPGSDDRVSANTEPYSDPASNERQFQLTYGATLTNLTPGQSVKVWIPIPPSNEQQTIEISSMAIPGEIHFARDSVYGNRIGQFEIPHVGAEGIGAEGTLDFQITYRVSRIESKPYPNARPLTASQRDSLLGPNALVPTSGVPLKLIAKLPETLNTMETGKTIYDTVLQHLNYDKSKPGFGNGDVLWTCDSRTGNCTDFHSLFMSLMRSRTIPTRFEIGFSIPTAPTGPLTGYHCWAWFLSAERGWIPVDISEADKHPEMKAYYFGHLTPNRVTFSTGRDIPLTGQPETKLNYFIFPYVEVDQRPIDKKQVELKLRYQDLPKPSPAD